MGVTIEELELADEPARWAGFGFRVDGERCLLGEVPVRLSGSRPGTGIAGWSLGGLERPDLDGLPTVVAQAAQRPAEPAGAHRNGVLGIDHVVAVAPDFERAVAALRAAGLDLRRIREEPTPAGAPRQAFFRLGTVILELVAEPEQVAAKRAGSQAPTFFWGLALLCEDIEATAASFGEHVSEVREAVQPGRRIATVSRSAGLAVPVALMSPRPARVGAG